MTSDGNPYARFRRALATGNINLVVAAAAELPRVSLRDALQVCLLLRDSGDPERYDRAAVRWAGRFALEAQQVTLVAILEAVDALAGLPHDAADSMERLARLCAAHHVG